ncbi:hypothetical protein BH23THE1_BH23THE1_22050 [soil metagenome]
MKIDWPSYNLNLVKRGEILFSYDYLDTWDSELYVMNKNKKGKPFVFPDSFILAIGYIRGVLFNYHTDRLKVLSTLSYR